MGKLINTDRYNHMSQLISKQHCTVHDDCQYESTA